MKILFIGDVVGEPGRRILRSALGRLRSEISPDLVIVNGENAAGGNGITPATADEIFRAGVDVITTGNHVWDRPEIVPYLHAHERLLRPRNYPAASPGRGLCVVRARDATSVAIVNLMGRIFLGPLDCPFIAADSALQEIGNAARVVVVDIHAEATSEKLALGWYLDGRVSAVVGTHTHVVTADERVLPGGTAYITDVGMTGPHDSVIGVEKSKVLERFLTQRPVRFTPASGDVRLAAVVLEISPSDGRASSIVRIEVREAPSGRSLA